VRIPSTGVALGDRVVDALSRKGQIAHSNSDGVGDRVRDGRGHGGIDKLAGALRPERTRPDDPSLWGESRTRLLNQTKIVVASPTIQAPRWIASTLVPRVWKIAP